MNLRYNEIVSRVLMDMDLMGYSAQIIVYDEHQLSVDDVIHLPISEQIDNLDNKDRSEFFNLFITEHILDCIAQQVWGDLSEMDQKYLVDVYPVRVIQNFRISTRHQALIDRGLIDIYQVHGVDYGLILSDMGRRIVRVCKKQAIT